MSTILDALKKSEQERKLNKIPTLSDMPTPQEESRWPLMLLLVVTFLLLVLIGFVVSQWWSGRSDEAAPSTTTVISNETIESSVPNSNSQSQDDIVVNVITYSEQPSQRFVMINGKLFRENEFVRAGLKVEQIKVDEVVLNLRGRRISRTR